MSWRNRIGIASLIDLPGSIFVEGLHRTGNDHPKVAGLTLIRADPWADIRGPVPTRSQGQTHYPMPPDHNGLYPCIRRRVHFTTF